MSQCTKEYVRTILPGPRLAYIWFCNWNRPMLCQISLVRYAATSTPICSMSLLKTVEGLGCVRHCSKTIGRLDSAIWSSSRYQGVPDVDAIAGQNITREGSFSAPRYEFELLLCDLFPVYSKTNNLLRYCDLLIDLGCTRGTSTWDVPSRTCIIVWYGCLAGQFLCTKL